MKSALIVFVASLASTAMATPKPLIKGWSQEVTYCNRGWGGDGSCEADGRYTFCCGDPHDDPDEFSNSKFYAYEMTNGGPCFGGLGVITCAE